MWSSFLEVFFKFQSLKSECLGLVMNQNIAVEENFPILFRKYFFSPGPVGVPIFRPNGEGEHFSNRTKWIGKFAEGGKFSNLENWKFFFQNLMNWNICSREKFSDFPINRKFFHFSNFFETSFHLRNRVDRNRATWITMD